MSKSLIKKLSKINIGNIKDVEQIYVDDEYGLKSYPKLTTLFGIFLENYKKCEKIILIYFDKQKKQFIY